MDVELSQTGIPKAGRIGGLTWIELNSHQIEYVANIFREHARQGKPLILAAEICGFGYETYRKYLKKATDRSAQTPKEQQLIDYLIYNVELGNAEFAYKQREKIDQADDWKASKELIEMITPEHGKNAGGDAGEADQDQVFTVRYNRERKTKTKIEITQEDDMEAIDVDTIVTE